MAKRAPRVLSRVELLAAPIQADTTASVWAQPAGDEEPETVPWPPDEGEDDDDDFERPLYDGLPSELDDIDMLQAMADEEYEEEWEEDADDDDDEFDDEAEELFELTRDGDGIFAADDDGDDDPDEPSSLMDRDNVAGDDDAY